MAETKQTSVQLLERSDSLVEENFQKVREKRAVAKEIAEVLSQIREESESLNSNIREDEKSWLALKEVCLSVEKSAQEARQSAEKSAQEAEEAAKVAEEAQAKANERQKWSETCRGQLEKALEKQEEVNSSLQTQRETLGRLEKDKQLSEEKLISAQQEIRVLQEEFDVKKKNLERLIRELEASNSMLLDVLDAGSTSSSDSDASSQQIKKLKGGWYTGVSSTECPGKPWYKHPDLCPDGTWTRPEEIPDDGEVSLLSSLNGSVVFREDSSSSSNSTVPLAIETSASSGDDDSSSSFTSGPVTPAMTDNDIVNSAAEIHIWPGGENRITEQDQQHLVCEQVRENGKASSSSSDFLALPGSSFSSSVASSSPRGRLETSLGTNRSPLKRSRNGDLPEVIKPGFSSTRGPLQSPSHHSRGTTFPDGGLDTRSRENRKPTKKKAKKSEGKSRGTSVSQFQSDEPEDYEEPDDPKDSDFDVSNEPESDDSQWEPDTSDDESGLLGN